MKKKNATNQPQILSPENYIRQKSKNLPIGKCFVMKTWKKQKFCQIIITRKHSNGNVSACLYLVDLACLGVKDTTYKFNVPFEDIEVILEPAKDSGHDFIEVPYELVHNIIYAALEFAEEYGLKPHKDFTSTTRHFLEEDTEDIPLIEIACGGDDGKPLYVNSGHDTPARAKQILAQLQKTAGEGNYHYIIPGEDYEEVFEDGDEDDEDIEDEDDENDEEDEIIAKIQQLGKEERKKMFIELIEKKNLEKSSDDEIKTLLALSKFLAHDYSDETKIHEEFEIFKKKFDHEVVGTEEHPNSLFADIQHVDGKILVDLFFNAIDCVAENNKPKNAIREFRNEAGECLATDFLELFYVQKKKSRKKYEKHLAELAQKHPHYFLIQTYFCVNQQHENNKKTLEQLEKIWHDEKLPVTLYEADTFFIFYAIHLTTDVTDLALSTLLAFEQFIKVYDGITEEAYYEIISTIHIGKMLALMLYLK